MAYIVPTQNDCEFQKSWYYLQLGYKLLDGAGMRNYLYRAALSVIFGLFLNDVAAAQNSVLETIREIAKEYNHILIDFSQDEDVASRFQPGSFVYREDYNPSITNYDISQFGSLCIPAYSTALINELPTERDVNTPMMRRVPPVISLSSEYVKDVLGLRHLGEFMENATARVAEQKEFSFSNNQLNEIRERLGPICRETINKNIERNDNAFQIAKVLSMRIDYEFEHSARISQAERNRMKKEIERAFEDISNVSIPDNSSVVVTGKLSVYGLSIEPVKAPI